MPVYYTYYTYINISFFLFNIVKYFRHTKKGFREIAYAKISTMLEVKVLWYIDGLYAMTTKKRKKQSTLEMLCSKFATAAETESLKRVE